MTEYCERHHRRSWKGVALECRSLAESRQRAELSVNHRRSSMTVAIIGRRERRARNRLNFRFSRANKVGGALETKSFAMQINSTESRFPVSSPRLQEVHQRQTAKLSHGDCVTQAKQHSVNAALVAQSSQPKQLFSIIVVAVGYETGELKHFDIPRTFQQLLGRVEVVSRETWL